MEDLFSIHLKKSSHNPELFMELANDSFMDRFTPFKVTSRKHPRSIGLMSSEENLSFRIEDECTDNDRVR
jgi:hypothetical protein